MAEKGCVYPAIAEKLEQGSSVDCLLPGEGRIRIDRLLPFLCLYRYASGKGDDGTGSLIQGTSSYIIASESSKQKKELATLIHDVVETISEKYGSCLVIEIWSETTDDSAVESDEYPPAPRFTVHVNRMRSPVHTVDSLISGLKEISVMRRRAEVAVRTGAGEWAGRGASLLSAGECRKMNCYVIGVEISPFYRDQETDEVYPSLLHKAGHKIVRAVNQAVFTFSLYQTNHRFSSFLELGRRALSRAVWETDRRLAEIESSFDFLLLVTPVNIAKGWNEFKQNGFVKKPVFYYRPLTIYPFELKKRLYSIPLEKVEDPALINIFREKVVEIDRALSMLRDRDTPAFRWGSLQLFGGVSDSLKRLASEILKNVSPHSREMKSSGTLNAGSFAELAQKEIDYYRERYPDLEGTVQVRDDIVGLMVSKGSLLVGKKLKVPESRADALIQHEVGTHLLTYMNGRAQPLRQLYTGLEGYDELQEGLAVLAEYMVGGLSRPRLRLLAGRVIAADMMLAGAEFTDVFDYIHRTLEFSQYNSYLITSRIFRGGGLTKDAVYLRGLAEILEYFKRGGDLEPLFVGKIAAKHIPVIRELQERRILKPIPLLPRYLDRPEAVKRLEALRNGITVFDLTTGRIK